MVQLDYNAEKRVMTASFVGRMDTPAVERFSEILMFNLKPGENNVKDSVVFDLKEVDYISSSFIRICVRMAKEAGKGHFSIINCQPHVKKTFKISGLDEILNIS